MYVQPSTAPAFPRWLQFVIVLLAFAIAAAGYQFHQHQQQLLRAHVESELTSVAQLKIKQISDWREEQLRDAALLADRIFFRSAIEEWMESQNPALRGEIHARLQNLCRYNQYRDVILTDPEGNVLLSASGNISAISPETKAVVAESLASNTPRLSDLHVDAEIANAHLDIIAPLVNQQSSPPKAVGAVLLVSSASDFLYPILNSWPIPNRQGEIVLARRDGNDVLFLNELKRYPGAVLKLRLPLDKSNVPASMAVSGREGIYEGRDYSGRHVLAYLGPVPGSPWYAVVKEDAAEAFSLARLRGTITLGLIAAVLGGLAAFALVFWQRLRLSHYREMSEAASEIHTQKQYLEATLLSIGDAVVTTDTAGRVIHLNNVAENLMGWRLEEARGMLLDTTFRIVNAYTRKPAENPVHRVLAEGRICGLANHTVLISRTGAEYQIADSAAPIKTPDGTTAGVVLVFRDVTKEYGLQRQLQESEERYRLLFQNANDGVVVHEVSEDGPGKIIDVNERACRLFGYGREEMLETNPAILRVPGNEARGQGILAQLFTSGSSFLETQLRTKDDRKIPVELSTRLFKLNGRDTVLSIIRDITERKRAEAELVEEKERLAVTLRSIGDAVISTDIEGRIVLMNKAAESLTGWPQDEAQGRPLPEVFRIINENTRKTCENPVEKVLRTGEVINLANHTALITRDGKEITIVDSAAPIKDGEGKTLGVVLVFRDNSEKRRAEEILLRAQRLSSIGLLAGGIAHDFNNLLVGILGHIDVARDCVEAGASAEALGHLSRSLNVFDRAKDLTQQLLTFSRGGAPARKTGDIAATLRSTVQFALAGSNVRAEYMIDKDLAYCDYDPNQIGQAIDNLVINAKHAMPQGGVLQISARNCALNDGGVPLAPGKYVSITIRDCGIGIPKEYLSKIFDPFFSTKQSGSGLGLPIAESVIKQHDGHIDVESEPGRGTVFTIYLPASTATALPPVDDVTQHSTAPAKILVMDDEEPVRRVMYAMLTSLGHSVTVSSSGEEALALFAEAIAKKEPFAAVILDLTIRDGTGGKETIIRLRELDPDIRAIASSGYSADQVMSEPQTFGFNAAIKKPFRKTELAQVVAAVFTELI